uniref:Uncharacterized protein n=1 Tax=Amphimedon queenslandica TaxID=400682 RepID=A0A1X7UAX2_AMPQE
MDKFINEVYYRSPPGQPRGPTQDIHGYELVDLDLKRNVQPLKAAETTAKDECATKDKYTGKDKCTFKKPEWPVVVLIVLLSLILALLVIILCMIIAVIATKDDSPGPDLSCNCTELIDGLIYQERFPNFTKWANDVSHKVNTDVRESLPNFTQWSNDVVHKVNTNITKTFPQWADNVVHNVRESFPNFTQQTNDVVRRVNTNVTLSIPKFTEIDSQILQTASRSAQDLATIINSLTSLQNTSTSTAGVVDDILATRKALRVILANFLPTSCKQIFTQFPISPSGYYALASDNGSAKYSAYCNMEELCGSRGWTRLANLNVSNVTVNCPSGFRLYQLGGVRACGRPTTNGGSCASVQFPSNGIKYSQICGRVVGYQYGYTTVAYNTPYPNDLNSYYVDGVSITRGSPRQHVWTLMAGYSETRTGSYTCPCNTGTTASVQSFIGNNYFCESGNINYGASLQLYSSDPLWDGYNCQSNEVPCCSAPGIPWFHKDY